MLARPEKQPRRPPRASGPARPEFSWEKFSAIVHEIRPLNQDTVPLDPDWDRYLALENADLMHVLTVRVDGSLVGYVFVCVGPHLHYASTKWAVVDMFWLNPLYRVGWTGVRMMRDLEKGVSEIGAKVLHISHKMHVKEGRVSSIFRRLGYRPIEEIWAKTLER
jgi:hypothetical protein